MRSPCAPLLLLLIGCQEPQRAILNSAGSYALQFTQTGAPCIVGELERPSLLTIEGWFMLPTDATSPILPLWVWENELAVFITPDDVLYVNTGEALPTGLATPVGIRDGEWHHVAITWDTFEAQIFIDGALLDTGALPVKGNTNTTLHMGCWPREGNIVGLVDDVRISSSIRYADSFTPQADHSVDEDSIATWRLDEGYGLTATDTEAVHSLVLRELYWLPLETGADPDRSDSGR
jgi:hypothetical protein